MSSPTHFWRTCEHCGEDFSQHLDHKDSDNPAEAICDVCYEAELYEHSEGLCDGDCIICAEEKSLRQDKVQEDGLSTKPATGRPVVTTLSRNARTTN